MKLLEILWLKMVNDLKEDTNKHMIEVKKYFWDLENED